MKMAALYSRNWDSANTRSIPALISAVSYGYNTCVDSVYTLSSVWNWIVAADILRVVNSFWGV